MSVPQFTTPTFILTIEGEQIDLTEAKNVYVTFRTKGYELTKPSSELDIEEKSIGVYLSQEETSHMPTGYIEIQANWTMQNGSRIDRVATESVTYPISKQLLKQVIE